MLLEVLPHLVTSRDAGLDVGKLPGEPLILTIDLSLVH